MRNPCDASVKTTGHGADEGFMTIDRYAVGLDAENVGLSMGPRIELDAQGGGGQTLAGRTQLRARELGACEY